MDERDERLANAELALDYHHGFLDDLLGGILPHDLILIGAPPGAGKTDFVTQTVAANVKTGAAVAMFALEADPREAERRIKFAAISSWVHADNAARPESERVDTKFFTFTNWMRGRCEHIAGPYEARAMKMFLDKYGRLQTFYRSVEFGTRELMESIKAIADRVRLIVIDHLHYVDIEDDNETRGISDLMKMLRDMALVTGKPIMLVAHLRKRSFGSKQVVTSLDDFHGSSNIVKQATTAIALDRAKDIEPSEWWLSPTYCSVLKDRRGGESGYVALTMYNRRTRVYQTPYTLGRLTTGDTKWEEVALDRLPSWARRHQRAAFA